jgi:hypothetical protein
LKTRPHLPFLKDLADVRSGFSFRSGIEEDPKGNVVVFQIRSLVQREAVQATDGVRVFFPDVSPSLLLRRGDVLFSARGLRNVGAVIDFDPDRAIASGQLLWMRPRSELVDPAYLAWWLNQEPTQQFLDIHKRGTRMPMVTRSTLLELPVSLPSLDVQRRFVELDHLHRREQELTARLSEMRGQHYKSQLQAIIRNNLTGRIKTSTN